ncbi:MAG: hypothetical protein WCO06_00085 [Candidatus Roizmanbacteria bacterium]
MTKQPLRIGLDLDGVILYNPARIIRPLIALIKNQLGIKKTKFYIPKKPWEKQLWLLFHKSSLYVAPGFRDIQKLADKKLVKVYIITARYSFLKDDFEKWISKSKADTFVEAYFHNTNDEQPHIYKEKMIQSLDLDYFVEDNLDIVRHLTSQNQKGRIKTKSLWIYNILDRKDVFENKFPSLRKAIQHISTIHNLNKKIT